VLHRVATAVTVAAGLCALAGCAASSAAPGRAGSASASATPSSAPSASAAPGGTAGRVVVDERDNHKVVRVSRGSVVTVVLHSTYWRFGPAPAPHVLPQISAPHVSPRPPNAGGCVPGQGCGTVTVAYRAAAAGTVFIRASRVSCGEALRCTGGNGLFSVTLIVRR
jgi:hypothetical protein